MTLKQEEKRSDLKECKQDQITALKAQIIAIRDDEGMTDDDKRTAMDAVVWL